MEESIKTTLAIHAKYQAFRLAEGLARLGILNEIYTVYPKFKIPPYKIPLDRVGSISFLGALRYLNTRWGIEIPDPAFSFIFDSIVARSIKNPGGKWIFHGWSGFTEKSILRAKKLGAITVVERSCPHIEFQRELVAEEKTFLLHRNVPKEENATFPKMLREYEAADYIIVPSNYSLNSFLRRGFSREKVLVIPLCNEKLTTQPTNSAVVKKDKFKVLCVGGAFYRKGIYYLLKAWKSLNLQDAELIIKAKIPEEFQELANQKNITILPDYLSDDAMGKLYRSASLFVLPSIDEGFGMVVPEAMSAGLPVIVTENVGAADGIENGKEGFVVPIRNPEALADRIKFFYDNPAELISMGAAALEKSKIYTPEAYANRVAAAYRDKMR